MADYSINAILKADARSFIAELKKSETALNKFGQTTNKTLGTNGVTKKFSAATKSVSALTAVITAEAAVLKTIIKGVKEYSDTYRTQQIAELQLTAAIKNNPLVNGTAAQGLKDFASEMQRVSNYGDEKLLPMMSNLIATGRTEAQVQKIMKAAIDLSATGAMSLETAVTQLNATLNGNIGRLGQQNAELKLLSDEELKNGKAVDILAKKYEGLGKATINSTTQMKNAKGDFEEAIGRLTLPTSELINKFWTSWYEGGTKAINKFNEYWEINSTGKFLEKEIKNIAATIQKANPGNSINDILKDFNVLSDIMKNMTEDQILDYQKYIKQLGYNTTEWQRRFNKLAGNELKLKQYAAEEEAKVTKQKEEQTQKQKTVNEIVAAAYEKIKKQKLEWEGIEKITGEEVENEEKIDFYQKVLLDAIVDSNGAINEQSALYKDILKTISSLKPAIEKSIPTSPFEIVREKIKDFLEKFKETFPELYGKIEDIVKKIKEKIQEIAKYAAIIIPAFNNVCKGIAKGFATAFQTVGKVVSKTVTGVKNAVSKMYSGIKKLTEFSIDDSLDALLKFEDGILTFVFETLPQMPQFLTQVFGSISIMFRTIEKQTGNMGGIFSQMISMITTNLPGLFESAVNITTGVFTQLATAVQANAPEIVNAFGSMFLTVGNALPGIIDNLFATVGKLLSELGKYLTSNKEKFENTLKAIIASIINGLREFVKNGGLKNLLDGLLAVQQAIEEAVVDNIDEIAEFISEALPDIMSFLKDSIISASKTLGELAPTLLKSLGELIGAIFAVAFDPDVIESSFGAIRGIISGLIQAIVAFVTKIIPVLIEALVAAPKFIPELISGILSGIVDGFLHADWLGIIKACFDGFIEGFKDLFGIHSPSTVFEGFGGDIVEGLKIGLEGFAEVLEVLMEPLETLVDNLTNFSSIGGGFEKMFNGIANVVKVSGKVIIGVLGGVVAALADVHNELRDIIKSVTTIKVWTPWETYEIGGVDIGKVKSPDISSYLNLVDKLATGTNNARKGLTLVGEAGPELVNFRGGEQVYNNHNTEKMLANAGGNTNNFNVVFNNTQDTTAFAMMQQLKAYKRQLAFNGVL